MYQSEYYNDDVETSLIRKLYFTLVCGDLTFYFQSMFFKLSVMETQLIFLQNYMVSRDSVHALLW